MLMNSIKLEHGKEMEICSVKELVTRLNTLLPDCKTVAILLTTEKFDHKNMSLLDDIIVVKVMDTLNVRSYFAFGYINGLHVREFLKKNRDFQKLYVCCDSGESRSSAMGAAILRYFGKSDMEIWRNPYFHPNTLVYTEQMSAFEKKVSAFRIRYLKYINNRAFRHAIRKGGN